MFSDFLIGHSFHFSARSSRCAFSIFTLLMRSHDVIVNPSFVVAVAVGFFFLQFFVSRATQNVSGPILKQPPMGSILLEMADDEVG